MCDDDLNEFAIDFFKLLGQPEPVPSPEPLQTFAQERPQHLLQPPLVPLSNAAHFPQGRGCSSWLTSQEQGVGVVGSSTDTGSQRQGRVKKEPDFKKQLATSRARPKKDPTKQFEEKFKELMDKLRTMKPGDLQEGFKKADMIARNIQAQLNLSRVYTIIAVDQLMTAVEIRDNPSLIDKPIIVVSKTIVHAANAIAKAAGVQENMTILAAYEKCPDVFIVLGDFQKYIRVIKEIREILQNYDENMRLTVDTAQMDLTNYMKSPIVKQRQMRVVDVVQEMRMKIHSKLQLQTYAGVAPTPILAKMASVVAKPNGVYVIEPTRDAIDSFLKGMRISEHCGICPRTEFILKSLDLFTTDDVWNKRSVLYFLMSPRTFKRLIGICLGTNVDNYVDKIHVWDLLPRSVTKSVTMYATRNLSFLKKVCAEVCVQMELELKTMGVVGMLVLVGVTTVENEVLKRAFRLKRVTNNAVLLFLMLHRFIERFVMQVPNTMVTQIRMHMLQLSKVEFVVPAAPARSIPSVLGPAGKIMSAVTGQVMQTPPAGNPTPSTSRAAASSSSKLVQRHSTQQFKCRFLPYTLRTKPNSFTCPNCGLSIKADFVKSGEDIMAKHVDFCLSSAFPELVGNLEL